MSTVEKIINEYESEKCYSNTEDMLGTIVAFLMSKLHYKTLILSKEDFEKMPVKNLQIYTNGEKIKIKCKY